MEKARTDKCLAEGEVTGHRHVVTAPSAVVHGEGIDRRLEAPDGTGVTHEEHGKIELPPGDYDVTRQQEVDPDTEEIYSVLD